jgi:uncharacterized protein YbbK (DUF523 family)
MATLYLVSACLLGMCITYNAASHPQPHLIALAARGQVLPLCPEIAGGLPIPRPPAEIVGGDGHAVLDGQACVRTRDGQDVTAAFLDGARLALDVAQALNITVAILQPRSPSCGTRQIYSGRFDGRLVTGQGVTAALLVRHGIRLHHLGQHPTGPAYATPERPGPKSG